MLAESLSLYLLPSRNRGHMKEFLTLFFISYAETSFIPECPQIPESERIDCAPGQVVTEVREMGSLSLACWDLFKRNEYAMWGEGGCGVDYGPLLRLEFFLPCPIDINNTKEEKEVG